MSEEKGVVFGEYVRKLRLDKGMSLRVFSRLVEEDPGNVSRIERGRLYPPEDGERIDKWANALGLTRDEQKQNFIDLASIARGELPRDLLNDDEVANLLPLVFRTIRGERVTKEKLEEIAAVIRKG